MRACTVTPLATAAIMAVAMPIARADDGWSGSAHAGLAFTQHEGNVTSGVWATVLHTFVPAASAGVEAGYLRLAEPTYPISWAASPWIRESVGAEASTGMFSASAAVKIRGRGPASAHMIGTFGYYHRAELPLPNYEWNPGFSLGVGFSGSGLVRPSFQLRWHELIGPENTNMDVVTFEAGLHFD